VESELVMAVLCGVQTDEITMQEHAMVLSVLSLRIKDTQLLTLF
jgi:hypothetical protein